MHLLFHGIVAYIVEQMEDFMKRDGLNKKFEKEVNQHLLELCMSTETRLGQDKDSSEEAMVGSKQNWILSRHSLHVCLFLSARCNPGTFQHKPRLRRVHSENAACTACNDVHACVSIHKRQLLQSNCQTKVLSNCELRLFIYCKFPTLKTLETRISKFDSIRLVMDSHNILGEGVWF